MSRYLQALLSSPAPLSVPELAEHAGERHLANAYAIAHRLVGAGLAIWTEAPRELAARRRLEPTRLGWNFHKHMEDIEDAG